MNQKGIAPIAIILIIIGVLALGGGAWYYSEVKKNNIVNRNWDFGLLGKNQKETIPPVEFPEVTKGQVIIATDKTEYEQGEIVKITVKNDFNKSIWYVKELCDPSCCYLLKWKDNKWESLGGIMPCLQFARRIIGVNKLEPGESIRKQWDMRIAHNRVAENGKYKLSFFYGLSKNNPTEKTIYSNEFMIKDRVDF